MKTKFIIIVLITIITSCAGKLVYENHSINYVPPTESEIILGNSCPNPVYNIAAISITLKNIRMTTLEIYNIYGKNIRCFSLISGQQIVVWDGTDSSNNKCGSGVYLYKIKNGSQIKK